MKSVIIDAWNEGIFGFVPRSVFTGLTAHSRDWWKKQISFSGPSSSIFENLTKLFDIIHLRHCAKNEIFTRRIKRRDIMQNYRKGQHSWKNFLQPQYATLCLRPIAVPARRCSPKPSSTIPVQLPASVKSKMVQQSPTLTKKSTAVGSPYIPRSFQFSTKISSWTCWIRLAIWILSVRWSPRCAWQIVPWCW